MKRTQSPMEFFSNASATPLAFFKHKLLGGEHPKYVIEALQKLELLGIDFTKLEKEELQTHLHQLQTEMLKIIQSKITDELKDATQDPANNY